MKYILHSIEIRTGEQWDGKGVLMLYSDLALGFCRVILYMIFMLVMMKIHTFPLFAIRPMFIAMKYVFDRCGDLAFTFVVVELFVSRAMMSSNPDEPFRI